MTRTQVVELMAKGKHVCLVEISGGEPGSFPAKIVDGKPRPESHFIKYEVISDGESAEVTLYSQRGATSAPAALPFAKGGLGTARTVAVVGGMFERSEYGVRCPRAEFVELLAAESETGTAGGPKK